MSTCMMVPSTPGYDPSKFDVNGKRLVDRKEPNADWIDTPEASATLCTTPSTLSSLYQIPGMGNALSRVSRSKNGKSGQAVGHLYLRSDVELLTRIRKQARLSLSQAARVLIAITEGRI